MNGFTVDTIIDRLKLEKINVPCRDNGKVFTVTDRLDGIYRQLIMPEPLGDLFPLWGCVHDGKLAKLYAQTERWPMEDCVLISCHVDSLYAQYYHRVEGAELLGTFDNSLCNVILVDLMNERYALPGSIVVAFTGDEEQSSRGADEVMVFLKKKQCLPKVVISLDVTEAGFGDHDFTIENYFAGHPGKIPGGEAGFLKFLKKAFPGEVLSIHHEDADADESWQYDEHNVHCFSLCLPCRPISFDMHQDSGVRVRFESIKAYRSALLHLSRHLDRDGEPPFDL